MNPLNPLHIAGWGHTPFSKLDNLDLEQLIGVSQDVMAAMQLSAPAGAMQIDGARRGAVFNMGSAAVAKDLSVLEAV